LPVKNVNPRPRRQHSCHGAQVRWGQGIRDHKQGVLNLPFLLQAWCLNEGMAIHTALGGQEK
jgi:hypothetical protein